MTETTEAHADLTPDPGADAATPTPTPISAVDDVPGPEAPQGMIPARNRRRTRLERGSMRVLATGGIIGIATALGAVLVDNDVAGWIVGLAVGLTSVILAALLWSSRQL
jgi:hypothetical protein